MSLPIKARLIVWHVALLAVILAALAAFLLVRLRSGLVAGIDRSLDTRAAQIVTSSERGGGEGNFHDVSESSLVHVPRGETADQILSPTGRVLQDAGDAVSQRPMIGRTDLPRLLAGARIDVTRSLGADGEPFRVLAVRIPNTRRILVVSESLDEVDQ